MSPVAAQQAESDKAVVKSTEPPAAPKVDLQVGARLPAARVHLRKEHERFLPAATVRALHRAPTTDVVPDPAEPPDFPWGGALTDPVRAVARHLDDIRAAWSGVEGPL